MEFFKEIIPFLKDRGVMFLLGVILCTVGLLQRFMGFDITLATGCAMVAIYLPLILRDAWIKRRSYDFRKSDEIMRRGQEALDRAKKR